MKKVLYGIGLVVALAAGFAASSFFLQKKQQRIADQKATVLLEQVRAALQLVTVEGQFNETYDEKRLREMRLWLPMPTTFQFAKTASIRVHGTVSVGYNLEQVSLELDSLQRRVTLSNLPEPEILAIDHEISYTDIDESWFNSFTPQDYTEINKNAKAALRRAAEQSRLMADAQARGDEMIKLIEELAETIGWTVEVAPSENRPAKDRRKDAIFNAN